MSYQIPEGFVGHETIACNSLEVILYGFLTESNTATSMLLESNLIFFEGCLFNLRLSLARVYIAFLSSGFMKGALFLLRNLALIVACLSTILRKVLVRWS